MAAETAFRQGHRQRVRARFFAEGVDRWEDYRIVELLLFSAIPRRDVKDIAHRLVARFGDLDGILSASPEELLSVEGVGPKVADMLEAVGGLDVFLSIKNGTKENDFLDYNKTGEFCVRYFGNSFEYETVMVTLNAKMEYIEMHSLYKADCESAAIKPKPFLDAVIKDRASIVIVAHNHPLGPTVPSNGDSETNKMLAEALSSIGAVLIEHYIVCGNKYVGFMNNLGAAFGQSYAKEIDAFLKSKEDGK